MKLFTILLLFLLVFPGTSIGEGERGAFRLISVDLQDTDFDNALRIISEVSNLDIVEIDKIDGRVTFRRIDTPWQDILDELASMNNATWRRTGNVIKIYKSSDVPPDDFKIYSGKNISIDPRHVTFQNVLIAIEKQIGETISGKEEMQCLDANQNERRLTLRFNDIPWDQVLDIIKEICERA